MTRRRQRLIERMKKRKKKKLVCDFMLFVHRTKLFDWPVWRKSIHQGRSYPFVDLILYIIFVITPLPQFSNLALNLPHFHHFLGHHLHSHHLNTQTMQTKVMQDLENRMMSSMSYGLFSVCPPKSSQIMSQSLLHTEKANKYIPLGLLFHIQLCVADHRFDEKTIME